MLEAGKYYVGDLCYILGDKNGYDWSSLLTKTGFLGLHKPGTQECLDEDENTGYFTTDSGAKFFSSGTSHGDGVYYDQQGREYGVDAGLIGCFPLKSLPEDPQMDGGNVVEFSKSFSCTTCDERGVITIGHLEIPTSGEVEEDTWD